MQIGCTLSVNKYPEAASINHDIIRGSLEPPTDGDLTRLPEPGGSVYEDARFYKPVPVGDLLATSDHDEKLVLVGDASMHPAELLEAAGSMYFYTRNPTPGLEWMRRLAEHFRSAAWLNPEPEQYWGQTTIQILSRLYPMFPLTIEGLSRAVRQLVKRH